MFSTFSRLSYQPTEQNELVIIKEDPVSGLSEFPAPGDIKRHLLPVLIDPELEQVEQHSIVLASASAEESVHEPDRKEFWMPDKYCKVCYGCEDVFTMYRRRHHCRMCGQIFCNTCSNFYIDGALINLHGPVRSCRLCFDQLFEPHHDTKQPRKKSESIDVESNPRGSLYDISAVAICKPGSIHELPREKLFHTNNLQKRSVSHSNTLHFGHKSISFVDTLHPGLRGTWK